MCQDGLVDVSLKDITLNSVTAIKERTQDARLLQRQFTDYQPYFTHQEVISLERLAATSAFRVISNLMVQNNFKIQVQHSETIISGSFRGRYPRYILSLLPVWTASNAFHPLTVVQTCRFPMQFVWHRDVQFGPHR